MLAVAARGLRQWIGAITAGLILISVIIWLFGTEQPVATSGQKEEAGLVVTVVEAVPGSARTRVNALGITMARWPAELTAAVSGRVTEVAVSAMPGQLVKQGETLAKLQDTLYQSELGSAKARLAEAELNVAELLNRQHVARNSARAQSAFGQLEPHVNAAMASRDAATAALASARQQLIDTTIKAPFDAVLIAERIHPGQWVNTGDVLFQLAASDFLDINVQLDESSWQRLNGSLHNSSAISVTSPDGQKWDASIRYFSPVMDPVTRQRSLVLQVANPFQRSSPLLADQQVEVQFEGATEVSVVQAPASVVTADGKVWSVIGKSLRLESIELLDEQPDAVLFRYQERPQQSRQLVLFPLGSFLEGQTVATTDF